MGVIFSCPQVLFAATIHVPAEQATIQAGINAAVNGDTVLVAPGVYLENVDFIGKSIVVTSNFVNSCDTSDIINTIIDGQGLGSVVTFSGHCDTTTCLMGITLINGKGTLAWTGNYFGSGIAIVEGATASPIVKYNYISNNVLHGPSNSQTVGAIGIVPTRGIPCPDSSRIYIFRNRIFDNYTYGHASAIYVEHRMNIRIEENVFHNNNALTSLPMNSNIEISYNSSAKIVNNTLASCSTTAITLSANGSAIILNNIFFNTINAATNVGGIYLSGPFSGYYEVDYNCFNAVEDPFSFTQSGLLDTSFINDNGTKCDSFGNVYCYPEFVDAMIYDYALLQTSPCIDAGDPDPVFNDLDGTRNDMGAIFYNQILCHSDTSISFDSVLLTGQRPYYLSHDDFNNDGWVDIVVTNNLSGSITIFLNNGSGDFASGTEYTTGSGPTGVVCFDYDNDSDKDIGVANWSSGNISLFSNNGNGVFVPNGQITAGAAPYHLASADFDGDLDFDLAVANHSSGNISILLNQGAGYFGSPTNYSTGYYPVFISAADLNGDDIIDLAVANWGSNEIAIFIGYGNGSFQNPLKIGGLYYPECLTIADFDRDDDQDIAVANRYSGNVTILLNDGAANYTISQSYLTGLEPITIASGDLNGDGYTDLAVSNLISNLIILLKGDGFGVFDTLGCYPIESKPIGIIVVDIDNDFDLDLISSVSDSSRLQVLRNQFDNLFIFISSFGIVEEEIGHVRSHFPILFWELSGSGVISQDSFHIQIGADDDWAYAEMWNPAPVASSDTFVTYAGAPLLDGETYYLRLRVHNGTIWSAWYDTLFRMNSLPSVPSPLNPADEEVVKETFPTLYIQNSSDAEADSLTYDFRIAKWNPLGPPFDPFVDSADNFEGEDSTGWTVPNEYPLEDNQKYFWMARSFDQFEKSGWSDPLRSFWVNTVEEAPWPFDLISPPDTSGSIIFDMLPQFYWRIVTEPDPFDNVTQTLYLAVDSNFQFVQTISDIPFNYYDLSDSLWFGTRYWWKVKAEDANGNATYSSNTLFFRTWKLGDANGDWVVNILDVTFLISALYKGGGQPLPSYVGDANGNCVTNILDATYLIAYLYKSGASPRAGCE